MKKIGCFREDGRGFGGNITTLQFSVQARFVPTTHKRGSTDPDFIVVQTRATGYLPEIGTAWERVSKEDGVRYLAVEIDDPSCQTPLRGKLWQADDGLWYLFWSRISAGKSDAESLLVQEELKPPIGWYRPPQRITTFIADFLPHLVAA